MQDDNDVVDQTSGKASSSLLTHKEKTRNSNESRHYDAI